MPPGDLRLRNQDLDQYWLYRAGLGTVHWRTDGLTCDLAGGPQLTAAGTLAADGPGPMSTVPEWDSDSEWTGRAIQVSARQTQSPSSTTAVRCYTCAADYYHHKEEKVTQQLHDYAGKAGLKKTQLFFQWVNTSTLSSPVDIQRIVVPLLSFNLPTMLPRSTMCCPGGSWPGRSSGPGQVRRELITFQCCFSTLCKEQSVLITVDYRRMLIQCHAEGLQRETRIVRSRQWCEMAPCLEGEVCSLLFNRSGWTCTRGSGRIKTVTGTYLFVIGCVYGGQYLSLSTTKDHSYTRADGNNPSASSVPPAFPCVQLTVALPGHTLQPNLLMEFEYAAHSPLPASH
ncbi:hypothetical protein Q8A73_014310 [Channa argus]|nr:hypothetical protein Q8A73_014310 [Channa argus]